MKDRRNIKYYITPFGHLVEIEQNPCGCHPFDIIYRHELDRGWAKNGVTISFRSQQHVNGFVRLKKLERLVGKIFIKKIYSKVNASLEEFKEYLKYDKDTGEFTWIKKNGYKMEINCKAGGINSRGYLVIAFKNRRYSVHRLVWFFEKGIWPKKIIDHINGNKLDNRIVNLREVTARQNNLNQKRHRAGKLVGAHFNVVSGKWSSSIAIDGKSIFLGNYDSELKAHNAYMKKLKVLSKLGGGI